MLLLVIGNIISLIRNVPVVRGHYVENSFVQHSNRYVSDYCLLCFSRFSRTLGDNND